MLWNTVEQFTQIKANAFLKNERKRKGKKKKFENGALPERQKRLMERRFLMLRIRMNVNKQRSGQEFA
jgi:hypothetical protein